METGTATARRPDVGQRVTVLIDDVGFGGEGVGRIGDFVVFVPFVITGEEVEIEVTEVRKSFARARLIRVIEPSRYRVRPDCPHFGECGGCQYQHVAYDEQNRMKYKQVADLMHRFGDVPPDRVMPVVPCPRPYGYRNRIMVRSQWNGREQRLIVGFIRHDNRWVEEVESCAIAEPELSAAIAGVRSNPPEKGGLKVALRKFPEGWEVPPDSFFQNNFHLLPGLVDTVRERLCDAATRRLLDLYCGVGFFAIELAGAVDRFVGVELDAMAIRAARQNAEHRGITNGEFIRGTSEQVLPRLLAEGGAAGTTVLVDPPRRGCAPSLIADLRASRPRQLIYVSCHPATLARDLKRLCEDGVFRVENVTPLDMFPQTQHVECVADLRGDGS
ncbi:MAG: class I SAM-dependent RNA methyltransferase [Verrucomicrobiae bacterium]|nr:class I SAM-dependent RNA methyltransferase [Verrucomicrobiae bacterium]